MAKRAVEPLQKKDNKRLLKLFFFAFILISFLGAVTKEDNPFFLQTEKLANKLIVRGSIIFGNVLRLGEVEIRSNYRLPDQVVLEQAKLSQAPLIFFTNPIKIRRLLTSHPWIDDARVELKLFPLRVTLYIEEARPWLVAELGEDTWVISRQGKVIENLKNITDPNLLFELSELVRLDGVKSESNSNYSLSGASSRFEHAVSVIKVIAAAGGVPFDVSGYTLLVDGSVKVLPVDMLNNPEVTLPAADFERTTAKLAVLKLILADLSSRREQAESIDMRFYGQSVVKINSSLEKKG